jgi:hypothetical protein
MNLHGDDSFLYWFSFPWSLDMVFGNGYGIGSGM